MPSQPLSNRKQIIAHHFSRADEYEKHALIQKKTCQILIDKIDQLTQHSVLEIGAGSGQLSRLLVQKITADRWQFNDLCATHFAKLSNLVEGAKVSIGDAETLDLGHDHSLIVSANTVQWFDNPLSFIKQSSRRLAKNGQLLFNTFTPQHFLQLRTLTHQGLHYPTPQAWRDQLHKHGLDLIELAIFTEDLHFDFPYQVLQHIKKTGVSVKGIQRSPKSQKDFSWNKASLHAFDQAYRHAFSTPEGKVVLTYETLLINARKR